MLKKIVNIIGWIVLLLAFASLGLNSDDKTFGFFFYLGFFIIVFGAVYLFIKKHHRKAEADQKKKILFQKIAGIILLLIALFSPLVALRDIQLPFTPNLLLFIATAVLVVLGALAVTLINKGKMLAFLGYLILIIISAIPAIFAISYLSEFFPNAYNALGTSYWTIVAVSIFAWWGFSLYSKRS